MLGNGPLALFLDFDGTLVEIAPTPDAIEVPQALAARLHDLAARLEGRLGLISGRGIADIESHLGPLQIARAGSHGIDRRLPDGTPLGGQPLAFPRSVSDELQAFACANGFSLESKPHGAALHYRARPELEGQGLAFAQDLAGRHQLLLKRGKCVIELVHPGADKGGAVRAFMQDDMFAGSRPLFIGDDVTDEDGFAAVLEFGGTGILIGDREPTLAQYRLADPAQLYQWLGL
ncbi:trehalose-phosphatase [Alteraurantiacibacter aestuarii]|uniref:trehalose-phosphatase n=1 Tax=Alteraurantiacibacter aestuarii TaxID=650004 RepID=UPI0031E20825